MTFCLLGEACCVYDHSTQSPGITHGFPVCTGCHNRIRADLHRLRYDFIDLSQMIPKGDMRNDAHIFRPKPESSPPMNMAAYNLRAQIVYFIGVCATVVRRHDRSSPRGRAGAAREGFALDDDLRFLVARAGLLVALGPVEHYWRDDEFVLSTMDGPAIVAEVGSMHHRAKQLCGLEPRTLRVPGDCPHCLVASLRRLDDDTERIWCEHCSRAMTGDEYSAVMRMKIADSA